MECGFAVYFGILTKNLNSMLNNTDRQKSFCASKDYIFFLNYTQGNCPVYTIVAAILRQNFWAKVSFACK